MPYKDPEKNNECHRRRYWQNPQKYNKDRSEVNKKACRKYYDGHKIWMIENCRICGRFCMKRHPNYCKDHGRDANGRWINN
jgi:hypothetical protein